MFTYILPNLQDPHIKVNVTSNMVCTGFPEDGTNHCEGDSGGAAVQRSVPQAGRAADIDAGAHTSGHRNAISTNYKKIIMTNSHLIRYLG